MGGVLLAVVGILLLFLGGSVKNSRYWCVQGGGQCFCRHFICGAVSDSARNLWKKYALRDGISGGHNDEHDKNNRRLLKRTDAFMLAIWFFTLFALLGGTAFYGGNLLSDLFGKKSAWGGKYGFFILVAAFALAEVFITQKHSARTLKSAFRL